MKTWEEYLKQSNRYIQEWEEHHELREAVASLLYGNERLNNIIKKLNYNIKKLDDMFYETFRISQNGYYSISEWELKDFTDKLQELKGDGNNEKNNENN